MTNQTQTHTVTQAMDQAQDEVANQPEEANEIMNCLDKIRNRFQEQSAKDGHFLEILHLYKKQRHTSVRIEEIITETDVYNEVVKLFENQEDLLQEFGQFLSDQFPPSNLLSAVFVEKI